MKKTVLALTLGLLIGSTGTAIAATSDTVQATFAKFNILVNGESKKLATDPLVVDGTSYFPVREVAGLLGFQLDYDANSRTIKLDNGVKPSASSKGVDIVTVQMKNEIGGRDLVELLASKFPELSDPSMPKISLHPDGTLKLDDKVFSLESRNSGLYDVGPLINAGILAESDIPQ